MFEQYSLWQTEKWRNFQKTLGFDTFFVEESGQKVLIILKKLPFGKCFLEIPRADFSSSMWLKIKEVADQKKAIFCRISPNSQSIPDFLIDVAVKTDAHRFPELTAVLDLTQSEEDILKSMAQQGRRHLRAAQKSGVEVFRSQNVDQYVALTKETTVRQGFCSHQSDFFKKLLETHGDDALMLLAKYEEKIVAGAIFVYAENSCTYLYGASANSVGKSQAPVLIQWEAIQIAKKNGKRFFDFLGIAPKESIDHPWAGVSQFKRKFGGYEKAYAPEVEIPFSKFWFWCFRVAQYIRKAIR